MLVTCVSANLWGTWRQGQPLSPLFWSCWRRGRWRHRWTWRKPRCPGWSRSLCLRTDRRERPGRWSERCPALGGAPAETCSSPQSARSDSPRLQPKTPVHGEGKTECNYTGRNTIKIYYDVMKHTQLTLNDPGKVFTDFPSHWNDWWWCGLTFPRYFSRDTVLPFASLTSKE